jgi:hypothetical protein
MLKPNSWNGFERTAAALSVLAALVFPAAGSGCLGGEDGAGEGGLSSESVPPEISTAYFATADCCTNDAECQDGLFCNGREHCNCWGECEPVDPRINACNDGNPCTADVCDEALDACSFTRIPGPGCGGCVTDADCNDGSVCTTDACDTTAMECTHALISCDDGDVCTEDTCDPTSGCAHTPIAGCCRTDADCDDGLPCTVGSCTVATGACVQTPLAAGTSCPDDGSLCTNDRCDAAGVCVHPSINCDDGSVCTSDTCNPSTGCVNTALGGCCRTSADCNDLNPCTTDTCNVATGVCSNGNVPAGTACPADSNPCTLDQCNGSGSCAHPPGPAGASCDDGLWCSTPDTCNGAGACTGPARSCADTLACTVDTCNDVADRCDSVLGADSCLIMSVCYARFDPNPANPCQWCDPSLTTAAFSNRPAGTTCSDGNVCTTGETCTAGACGGGSAVVCADDGNVCTTEACVNPGGCTRTNNTLACNDGNPCTTGEACSGGSCGGGSATVCADDGNICTTEACNPAVGCYRVNNTLACSDGNACTTGDRCSAGLCAAGTPVTCPTYQCRTQTCNTTTGLCQNASTAANGTNCTDEGVSITQCSAGRCQTGVCTTTALTGVACTPSSVPAPTMCYVGRCDAAAVCVPTYVPAPNDSCTAPSAAINIPLDAAGRGSVSSNTTCAANDFSGSCGGATGRDLVYYWSDTVDTSYQLHAYQVYTTAAFDSVLYERSGACGGSQAACNDNCASNSFLNCGTLGASSGYIINPRPVGSAFTDYVFPDGASSGAYGAFTLNVQRVPFENNIPCEIGPSPAYYYAPDITAGGTYRGHVLTSYINEWACGGPYYDYESMVVGPNCWQGYYTYGACYYDPCWPGWDSGAPFYCGSYRYRFESSNWPASAWFKILPAVSTRYRITIVDTAATPNAFDATITLRRIVNPNDCPRYATGMGCYSNPGMTTNTVWDVCVPAGQHWELGISKRRLADATNAVNVNYELQLQVLGTGGC